ncbi:hypothetical protein MXB_2461 [Myxobolus squamalis]|nr:hypothetical protein MXB_2461 [Myxobolus squamalis]
MLDDNKLYNFYFNFGKYFTCPNTLVSNEFDQTGIDLDVLFNKIHKLFDSILISAIFFHKNRIFLCFSPKFFEQAFFRCHEFSGKAITHDDWCVTFHFSRYSMPRIEKNTLDYQFNQMLKLEVHDTDASTLLQKYPYYFQDEETMAIYYQTDREKYLKDCNTFHFEFHHLKNTMTLPHSLKIKRSGK